MPIDRTLIYERLPGYSSAHGSSVAMRPNGELICAWFSGAEQKGGHGVVMCARKPPGAAGWQDVRAVLGMTDPLAYGNAALYVEPTPAGERISLFYVRIERPEGNFEGRTRGDDSTSYVVESSDGGWSWGEPRRLRELQSFLIKNKPFRLPSGERVLAAYSDTDRLSWCGTRRPDGSWAFGEPVPAPPGSTGLIQPALAAWPDGELQMYLRTDDRRIWRAHSHDEGRTWSQAEPTDLVNPDTGIDAQVLADGRLFLVHNPVERGRTPLALRISTDRGATWTEPIVLVEGEGEFSYPAIIQTPDRRVHVTYSHLRRQIGHLVIDPATV